MKGKLLSRVRLFATPWTAAYQAPPSMGFSRQEYVSGVPLPNLIIICLYPDPLLIRGLHVTFFSTNAFHFITKSCLFTILITLIFNSDQTLSEKLLIFYSHNPSKSILIFRSITNSYSFPFHPVNYISPFGSLHLILWPSFISLSIYLYH